MSLQPIPQPPRWSNGSLREDVPGLLNVWNTLVWALTTALPNLLRRLAYDIDSHR